MKFLLCAVAIAAQLMAPAWAQWMPPALTPNSPNVTAQRLFWSNYTLHFHEDGEHKTVLVIGVEREYADGKLDGLSLFTNSFGQNSAYLYPWGAVYKNIHGIDRTFFKWTAGLLYGYVEPYENKVPLNHNGFSPGAILALGYEFQGGWSAQVNALGTAGLMFQLNMPLK